MSYDLSFMVPCVFLSAHHSYISIFCYTIGYVETVSSSMGVRLHTSKVLSNSGYSECSGILTNCYCSTIGNLIQSIAKY